jgi:hypothetical protein
LSVKGRTDLKINYYTHQMSKDIQRTVAAVILFLCLIQLPLGAQESTDEPAQEYAVLVEWAYGQDQELVNGLQYYNRHPRSLGHPYLLEGWVHQGSVSLRGKLYPGIWLKYDIYDQQVEVEYRTMNGADNQVILVSDRVDNFSIGSYFFERLKLEEDQERFYQVIGEGRMVWYIRWEKKLVPISGDSRFFEEYTSPKRSYLVILEGSTHPFNNQKSFVQLFPKDQQKDLKKLIKSNNIQIRTASIEQLELFIMAASNLLYGGAQ